MQWLIQHPEFMENNLYVGGESYSGILVPIVVQHLYGSKLHLTKETNRKPLLINLVNFISCTNCFSCFIEELKIIEEENLHHKLEPPSIYMILSTEIISVHII